MTLEKPKPTILEGNMQRFVQGAGSFVNISLTINKANPKINYTTNYAAFVTYDQGSNIGGFSLKSPQYMTYIIYFIIYIAASILGIFFLRRLIYRRRVLYLQRNIYDERLRHILPAYRMRLNWYYSAGKLHKADYELLVNILEEGMIASEMKEYRRPLVLNEGAPTKSVHKMKKYTSEGKLIITDEK